MNGQFAVLFLLLIAGNAYAQYTITYTVENQLDGFTFQYTMTLNNGNRDFYSLMQDAQKRNPFFKFESVYYGESLGHFITSVNGLKGDHSKKTFWGFLLRHENGDCKLPVGVSNYVPEPNDHVVLSYITYDMLDDLPKCEDPKALSKVAETTTVIS